MRYEEYLNRVRGCVLGLGRAPFLAPALGAAARFGPDLTALDLARAYAQEGVLSPHFQRNMERGVLPPLAAFDDPERDGAGGMDRAPLWACLCPGDPARAMRLARVDASTDHGGEAVEAAGFVAAAMALAFQEADAAACLLAASEFMREDSRIAKAVHDACALRAQPRDLARARLVWRHGGAEGSPLTRLTDLLAALLLDGSPTALSAAFAGVLNGAPNAGEADALAAQIAQTGLRFQMEAAHRGQALPLILTEIPAVNRGSYAREPVRLSVSFMGKPCLRPGLARQCVLSIENDGAETLEGPLSCVAEGCIQAMTAGRARVAPGQTARVPLTLWMPEAVPIVTERNRVTVRFAGHTLAFGIAGAQGYRVLGNPDFCVQPLSEPYFSDGNRVKLDSLSGWAGPCAFVLSRTLVMKTERELEIEVKHTCPFTLELDGEELLRGKGTDGYALARARTPGVRLSAGEHELRVRLDRRMPGEEIEINGYSQGRLLSMAAKNPLDGEDARAR